MSRAEFVTHIAPLDTARKIHFYISLARYLTIAGRVIWSNPDLSIDEQRERLKWLNEAMHRVINHLANLYNDTAPWSDDALWLTLRDTVAQHPPISGDIGGAVCAALDQLKRIHDDER